MVTFSYKDGWLVCGNEYKCDHFSVRDGAWSGAVQSLPRPLSPGYSFVIGILDTVRNKLNHRGKYE